MESQGGVEACCGKYAEALDDAEVFRGDKLHSEGTDEHHPERDGCANAVGAAALSRETWVTLREETWVTVCGCGG